MTEQIGTASLDQILLEATGLWTDLSVKTVSEEDKFGLLIGLCNHVQWNHFSVRKGSSKQVPSNLVSDSCIYSFGTYMKEISCPFYFNFSVKFYDYNYFYSVQSIRARELSPMKICFLIITLQILEDF